MASTYSDLKIELIATGEQSGTWGTTTNTNLGVAIEEAITGSADVTFSSAEVTLSLTDSNGTQTARNLRLNLVGVSGGAQNLVVPNIEKFYLINNTLNDTITVKNSTGATVAVPTNKAMLVFSTGAGVVDVVTHLGSVTLGTPLALDQGGTGATTAAGVRTNIGLGTIATQAASAVAITGGTITGITDLTVADGGTGASTAANARTNLGLAIGTDVPGPTGTGASGTWGISITGNAATATTATSSTPIANAGGWAVTPSGTTLYFSYNGTNVAKLDSSGNLTAKANVTAYGTI